MQGSELKTLTTQFLSGLVIDDTLFYTLLNMAKDILESSRDWMILRTEDTSKTFTSSDTYTSTKALPSRFLRIYEPYNSRRDEQSGVFIVDSAGNKRPLKPIKFAERFDYKDVDGYYYIDIKNSAIGRTGTLAGTLHLFYIEGTEAIDSDGTWTFPDYSHVLLAVEVAKIHKGGIDWDDVNANQVPYNQDVINKISSQLSHWDARLQQQELGV